MVNISIYLLILIEFYYFNYDLRVENVISINFFFFSDELGYLVDAIVSDEMIDSFDKRPNDMSIEVIFKHLYIQPTDINISFLLNKRKIIH